MVKDIQSFYRNKTVFITGHTGFKGAWLSLLMRLLGARVIGYALPPKADDLYRYLNFDQSIVSILSDIRDQKALSSALHEYEPDIIFHLAAQPLVRESYLDPITTYQTNILGTVNLLESCRELKNLKAVLNITTDKCYQNKERYTPYKESDALGGYDPYSASKACSEIVTHSYNQILFKEKQVGLASARAGNVIGGGDFSKDRILPDIVRAIQKNNPVTLRNPNAIRPWQHVFDVLYGYLLLGKKLMEKPLLYNEPFNFGPDHDQEMTVRMLSDKFVNLINRRIQIKSESALLNEAGILKLNADKSKIKLAWKPKLALEEAISLTGHWYKAYLENENMMLLSKKQLETYLS